MTEKIWDLTPEGGGPPVQVIIGNPNEAIAAHPQRYTRKAPDGTAQAMAAKRDAARAKQRAAIDEEHRAKAAEIEKGRQTKLAAIAKEQADAAKAKLEKERADAAEEAKKSGTVLDRSAEIAAVNAEADGLHELAKAEADEKKKVADATPLPVEATKAAPVHHEAHHSKAKDR